MKIQASSLANRFYKHDGWTRELVYSLLYSVEGHTPPRQEDSHTVEDRGDYYAVYDNNGKQAIFDADKVAQHEYEPYSPSECDRYFHQKNKVHKENPCSKEAK